MTTDLSEKIENHKGQICCYKPILCQEGYCDECAIPSQKQMLIYISAPYSLGDVAQNVRIACLASDKVLAKGHTPFVPHLYHLWHIISPKPYEEWLKIGLDLIPRVDAVLRLSGESRGADAEVALAKNLNIPVYYSLDEIEDND